MADAFHKLCVDATVNIVKGLALPRIDQNVVTQMIESQPQLQEPVAVVTTEGEPLTITNLTTGSRLVEFPVKLKVMDRVAAPGETLPEWLLWQEKILDAFPDRKKAEYPAGTIGLKLTCRKNVGNVGHQLAEGEWLLSYRAVRPIQ